MLAGLEASFKHADNGMTRPDMQACVSVAERLGEVIIFRSTGPWARRWIELGYPSKNFHVKGKSSDWGPQAGFVPHDGRLSKVGSDATKAAAGTALNNKGLHEGFAGKQVLTLTRSEINRQLKEAEEQPRRTAIKRVQPIEGSKNLLLFADRSGDKLEQLFLARLISADGGSRTNAAEGDRFEIFWYETKPNIFKVSDPRADHGKLGAKAVEVMTSAERNAERPMTGDYDLFAICPSWASYGSGIASPIMKPGLDIVGKGVQPGAAFLAGGLDNVLDPTLHTMGRPVSKSTTNSLSKNPVQPERQEHGDMGNLTPRILRTINMLNATMKHDKGNEALRRVHHNAESHRNRRFGALTGADMKKGEGLPLTVFAPTAVWRSGKAGPFAQAVLTIDNLQEFRDYAAFLEKIGFFVPNNEAWGSPARARFTAARTAMQNHFVKA